MELSQLVEDSGRFAGSEFSREHIQYRPDQGITDANNSSLAEATPDSFVNRWHYSGEAGEATFIQTEIRPGFDVWVTKCLFQRQVLFSQLNHPSALCFGLNLSGHVTSRVSTIDEDVVMRRGNHGLHYSPRFTDVGQIRSGIPYLQVGVILERNQLRHFFNDEKMLIPPFFQPILDRRPDGELFQMGAATADILKTGQEILNCRQHGLARKLFLESKALELLFHQMEYFASVNPHQEKPRAIHPEDQRQVEYAHDLLVSNIASPPQLMELARAVGMSHPKLNRCFKQIYGSTVFEYLRTERLLRARDMLEHQAVTVTEVAYSVGVNLRTSPHIRFYDISFSLSTS